MTFQALSDSSLRPDHRPHTTTRLAAITARLALLFLAWEALGGDLWLAGWAGQANGFALRDHWFMSGVMHRGVRVLAWLLALVLCAAVWWPVGPLRRLTKARRVQLAAGVLLSVLAVSVLKSFNPAACPWDLPNFGGHAQLVSHWLWWATPEGGRGRCFPAGHASAGFAFVGGYFVFRDSAPALSRRWLLIALAAGLLLGLTQQWRGAHFMSHTLWSGWVCWCLAWALDGVTGRCAANRGAGA